MVEEIQNPNSVPSGVNLHIIFFCLKYLCQLGETASRPGTGVGGVDLSRPHTGNIWTVEGDEALGEAGDDVQSMSPSGGVSLLTLYSQVRCSQHGGSD